MQILKEGSSRIACSSTEFQRHISSALAWISQSIVVHEDDCLLHQVYYEIITEEFYLTIKGLLYNNYNLNLTSKIHYICKDYSFPLSCLYCSQIREESHSKGQAVTKRKKIKMAQKYYQNQKYSLKRWQSKRMSSESLFCHFFCGNDSSNILFLLGISKTNM